MSTMRSTFRMSRGLPIAAIATLSFGAFAADPFTKERVERAKARNTTNAAGAQPSFWQSYKFMNPVTKTIEPKQMYCERLDERAICGGIYQ
jgi:hypothetical protein